MTLETIQADFEFLDDWEDRYRYVIELGRRLEPLSASDKNDRSKVRGCASQVWLICDAAEVDSGDPVLTFHGESDASIVQGLIAILLSIYNNKRASEILTTNPQSIFSALGLNDHLTPQRSNGLKSMVERIRAEAKATTVQSK
ncbi:MAG: SufE family protein [Hyphomicrobiaceae bacterium]